MLDRIHSPLPKPSNDPNAYTLGSIRKHNIVIACLPKGKYGTISASMVATWMVNTFPSIKVGLMVGIGGGIPPKVRLGDVVVSVPVDQFPGVVQWDMGKAEGGGTFKRTGALNNPPSALLTALTKLETQHEMHGSKIHDYLDDLGEKYPNLRSKYTWSDALKDPLFTPESSHRPRSRWQGILFQLLEIIWALLSCLLGWWVFAPIDRGAEQVASRARDELVRTRGRPGNTRVHYGLIASGNQVVKDAELRDSLDESLGGDVLCIEMEAAGLMNGFPCVVIRGICDYADSQKSKDWQEYAAAVAAAYAKELLEYVQTSDVDGQRPVKDILGKVLDTLQRTEANIETLRSKLDRKEDLEVLNWLTPVDYGPQHSDFLKRRQSGTGRWFLESAEYQTWLSAKNQTLFCPGIPGAGKTILTATVIDDLTTRFLDDQSIGIAYIYFNFRRQNEQKVEDLLASLLKQLSQEQPALPDSVGTLYKKHKDKGTRSSLDEISEALRSVAAKYSRAYIFIDALDECEVYGRRTKFLAEIFDLQAKCAVNVFATSRFIPQITERFKCSMTLEIRACDEDVRKYLKDRILQSESAILVPVSEEIQSGIINAVDGMFLLAQLHFDSIKSKKSMKKVREAIKHLPKGAEAYNHAYKDAMQRIEGHDVDSQNLAKDVLSWIVCAKRPLNTSELQHALAVEAGKSELDEDNLPLIEDMHRLDLYKLYDYSAKNWGHHARKASISCPELIRFLKCKTKLEASIQALRNEWEYSSPRIKVQMTGLHLAAYFGLEGAVNTLLSEEVATTVQTTDGQALPDARLDLKDGVQCTPLSWAAENGHEAVVKQLLDKGADPDLEDLFQRTPLSWAAENGHEAVVKLLLDKGADIDTISLDGLTPLSWAARYRHEAVVKQLLEKGADPDLKGRNGRTPLSWAAKNGHEAVVKQLLDKGADIDTRDEDGQTPLSWAAENGHEVVVKQLLDKGASPDLRDRYGRTPLLRAARKRHEVVVKQLLTKGADPDLKNKYGQTPLSSAARNGHEVVVKQLLDKGADIDTRDKIGQTPLSWAARYRHEAVVKQLLERGADPDLMDDYGQTPLSRAAENGHEAVVKQLLEKGADPDDNYRFYRNLCGLEILYGKLTTYLQMFERTKESSPPSPLSKIEATPQNKLFENR
ncbi:hypothetical protein CNMCM6936_005011 [Aspergillus lentulus]|nr:hypothetical protein CNMCM6936_005011 [Aspergillus lentulus]